MAFTQRLQQKLKTGIALTPQVQLTIALIQKTKAELVEVVRGLPLRSQVEVPGVRSPPLLECFVCTDRSGVYG